VLGVAGACRPALARVREELTARGGDWFFAPWNADCVSDPQGRRDIPFHQAPPDLLATEPGCWVLRPGESWHGFGRLPDGWCMLDPIKLGVVCPGMNRDGSLEASGIPGDLVTAYLARKGIVPSRTTDHMVLFLFSLGITKGKWGTLLNALLDFKTDYDRNAPLDDVVPQIVEASPARYAHMGLRYLADQLWLYLVESRIGHWQGLAYASLPAPKLAPREAFQRLMAGDVDHVPLDALAGRTAAVGLIPYPPGIPIVMPGENAGPADGPWITYLRALQEYGQRFPGFAKEVEGTEERAGAYYVYCVKD
jgi:arginine decarboxylase